MQQEESTQQQGKKQGSTWGLQQEAGTRTGVLLQTLGWNNSPFQRDTGCRDGSDPRFKAIYHPSHQRDRAEGDEAPATRGCWSIPNTSAIHDPLHPAIPAPKLNSSSGRNLGWVPPSLLLASFSTQPPSRTFPPHENPGAFLPTPAPRKRNRSGEGGEAGKPDASFPPFNPIAVRTGGR